MWKYYEIHSSHSCRFTEKENVSGVTQVKSSVIRNIRAELIEKYPGLEEFQDMILPKKESYRLVKW